MMTIATQKRQGLHFTRPAIARALFQSDFNRPALIAVGKSQQINDLDRPVPMLGSTAPTVRLLFSG
ncbi:hypothetical protein CAF53_13695 [Sphingobium sp. LB126]|nr:hypothetical protein CAF53_13695 [Sphingobium sp. LB126]